MPARLAVGPKCETGNCQCVPACAPQARRVEERLSIIRGMASAVPADTAPVVVLAAPPAGHEWLCAACQTIQQGPGAHCGYRILLVEKKDMTKDASGRVTRATCAQVPSHYRWSGQPVRELPGR